jgi:hypothetical protein
MWCAMCCAAKWKAANTCSADIPSLFSMLTSHPSSNSLLTTAEFPLFAAYMRAVKPCSSVSSIPHCGKPLLPRTQSRTMRTSPAKAARCRLVYLVEQVSFTPRNRCVDDMRRNRTWRNEKLASPEKNTLDGVGYFRKLIFLGTEHFYFGFYFIAGIGSSRSMQQISGLCVWCQLCDESRGCGSRGSTKAALHHLYLLHQSTACCSDVSATRFLQLPTAGKARGGWPSSL